MSRWTRWQFVVPRLLMCVVGSLAVYYAATVAVRSYAIRSGAALFGSSVDIANASVFFSDGHVRLSGLTVADPRRPELQLFTAEHCELEIAAAPLLEKRTIIERARMTGVRLGSPESADTTCTDAAMRASSPRRWFGDDASTATCDYLAKLSDHFGRQSIQNLESVKRTTELCQRLPDQFSVLDARTKAFLKDAAALEEAIEAVNSNRLRHDDTFSSVPVRVAALQKELDELCAEFEKLPAELEKSRRAIVAARRQDEKAIREQPKPIDHTILNEFLLREMAARSMDELIAGLEHIRRIIPERPSRLRPGRGENVLFAGLTPRANLLIRALEIDGELSLAGRPVDFRGRVENLTTTPLLVSEPIRVRISALGSAPMELRATIVRTECGAREEVFVNCGDIPIRECLLGRAEQLQLRLTPSTASLSMSLIVTGDKLCGDVQLIQNGVHLTPALGGALACPSMESPLRESLGQIGSLATRISLHGTLDRPSCQLWSNLGPAVAEALYSAIQQHNEENARTMLAEARRKVDEDLATLERQIEDQRAEFVRSTASMTERLEAIAQHQTRRERISIEQLGRRLPNNSLFR